MAKKRTVILLKSGPAPGAIEPLGSLSSLRAALANFNVAPDGSGPRGMGERLGTGVFFGPGMVMEVPLGADDPPDPDIAQVLVSVTDEDFAWPVLMRICKANQWKMMDPDSGRTFG